MYVLKKYHCTFYRSRLDTFKLRNVVPFHCICAYIIVLYSGFTIILTLILAFHSLVVLCVKKNELDVLKTVVIY